MSPPTVNSDVAEKPDVSASEYSSAGSLENPSGGSPENSSAASEIERFGSGRRGDLSAWIRHAADPRGVVVCVHGLGDHSGHFEDFADAATEDGWSVAAIDLPGHGDSPGTPGKVSSYTDCLLDIEAFRRDVAQRTDDAPQWLVGHSMGGNLSINYALRCESLSSENASRRTAPVDPPVGLVLLSPMLLPPQTVTRPQIFAAWLTGHLVPWFRVHKRAKVRDLTADPAQAKRIAADPRRHSKLSIYLATQLLSQGRWAIDHARELRLPTLLIYGEHDSLIDRDAVGNTAIRIGRDATIVHWPGGRHDLLHDRDSDSVRQRILTWMHSVHDLSADRLVA